jgi:5-methylcytosine-specific restriction endonuclease McrA
LKLSVDANKARVQPSEELLHNRLIPSAVKLEVWTRDKGQCVLCGSKKNLPSAVPDLTRFNTIHE